jgi:type I restriction enzyme, R subunit
MIMLCGATGLLGSNIADRLSSRGEPFRADGGFNRLNRIFGGELESVLALINDEMWQRAS